MLRFAPPRVCLCQSPAMAAAVAMFSQSTSCRLGRPTRFAWSPCCCSTPRLASPWLELAGVPPRHRRRPPWSSEKSFRASSGHAKATTGCGWMSGSCRCSRYRRRAHRRRAMAGQRRIHAAALFSVTDWWGRLTSGSPLSVTVVLKLVHLFPVLCASLKIDKLSCVDSKKL